MGKSQNIYDNEKFFNGYKQLREEKYNYNSLQEKPAIRSLLPDLNGMTVLDLGCGFGENCLYFIEQGAKKVIGIDISEKMLKVAEKENLNSRITYMQLDMNDIDVIKEKFDIIYSSLAFHYVNDFQKLLTNIRILLRENGMLIFSQEHPLTTAHKKGERWTKDEDGEYLYYNLSNYMESGERRVNWFIDDVIKYHRSFSEIVNELNESGFRIDRMVEPLPSKQDLELIPTMKKDIHKPNFLIIRAKTLIE